MATSTLCVIVSVLLLLLAGAHATCTYGQPSADSTINPVSFNSSLSSFSTNQADTTGNANYSSLLTLAVQWAPTNNRTITWIGIGSGNAECVPLISSPVSANSALGSWAIDAPDASCNVIASASYIWPMALYDTACGADITVATTGTTQTITFNIYVSYQDCAAISRDSATFTECNTITDSLPVEIVFPLNTNVTTGDPTIFSASSIQTTAALASTALILNNPGTSPSATFTFITMIGQSFQLVPYSVTGPGGQISVSLSSISAVSDVVQAPTRIQKWQIQVGLSVGVCDINGNYTTNFTVFWNGTDGSGTLPPSQDPIPNNSSVSVTFQMQSADFCASFLQSPITAVVHTYTVNATNYYDGAGVTPAEGFLTGETLYLAARVSSPNLPILSAQFSAIYVSTSEDTSLTPLSTTGINYGTVTGGTAGGYPRTDALAWFTLSGSQFDVPGDQSVQYIFTATITVTYNNNGQRKRDDITASYRLARTASTSVSAYTAALVSPAGATSSSTATSSLIPATLPLIVAAALAALMIIM
jgi:hypothetical protein